MEERMKDELWMQKIKERLEDYSEPLSASGWERLEKDLSAAKPPMAVVPRTVLFRRWAVAAAAVLLVAVSSVSIWLQQSSIGEEMRSVSVPALAVAPDVLPQQQTPAAQQGTIEPLRRAQGTVLPTKTSSLIAQQQNTDDVSQKESERVAVQEKAIEEIETENKPSEEEVVVRKESTEPRVERRRPSGRDKLHLPVGKKTASKARGWSVGLAVNAGGLASGGNLNALDYAQGDAAFGGSLGGKVDLAIMEDAIVNLPQGQELVFKNGMPYLQKREDQIASIDHKQPLSFGFSVRKGLTKGFSVETGLTYTYLASDVKYVGGADKVNQKLHYLGIPLRANWNFIDQKAFTMYVSAGGAVEKCVYGKIGSRDETVKPLQLSLMGAVGAQYNVSNRIGLYIEPGVSYFFDDGSQIETIRKENPLNFTLQAGIRLTY